MNINIGKSWVWLMSDTWGAFLVGCKLTVDPQDLSSGPFDL